MPRRHAVSALEMPRHVALVRKTAGKSGIRQCCSLPQFCLCFLKTTHDKVAVRTGAEGGPELSGKCEAVHRRQLFQVFHPHGFGTGFPQKPATGLERRPVQRAYS